MKTFLCALALAVLAIQPAFAGGISCWSSSSGNRLLVPPDDFAITYQHAGMVEPCNRMSGTGTSWRIWCDVSAVSGTLKLVPARSSETGQAVVLWDFQVFYRDQQCPWRAGR